MIYYAQTVFYAICGQLGKLNICSFWSCLNDSPLYKVGAWRSQKLLPGICVI